MRCCCFSCVFILDSNILTVKPHRQNTGMRLYETGSQIGDSVGTGLEMPEPPPMSTASTLNSSLEHAEGKSVSSSPWPSFICLIWKDFLKMARQRRVGKMPNKPGIHAWYHGIPAPSTEPLWHGHLWFDLWMTMVHPGRLPFTDKFGLNCPHGFPSDLKPEINTTLFHLYCNFITCPWESTFSKAFCEPQFVVSDNRSF